VIRRGLVAEVLGFLRKAADHRVVGDAPARDVVDAGVEPGDVERVVVGHRHGRQHAEVLGDAGHGDGQRQGVVARPGHAPFHRAVDLAMEHGRAGDVGEEASVELPMLQQPRKVEVEVGRPVMTVAVPRPWIAPHRQGVDQGKVCNQMNLPIF
jgi:hypothetical protein